MAIDPFSRRRPTADEWRARASKIQSELDGLTIDELMRGRARDDTMPHQPRIPAGHPDGGQWTDDEDELDEFSWVDVAGVGHHWYARQFYRRYPFSQETRRVFRAGTSGPLTSQLWSRRRNEWIKHGRGYDRAHREYDRAVDELVNGYMRDRKISPQQMTPAQAREVIELIQKSTDPRIQTFVKNIKILRRHFRMVWKRLKANRPKSAKDGQQRH